MKILKRNQGALGVGYVTGAYLLWGILPVYWKLLQNVPPVQILAHRIVWAFVFLLALLLITGKFVVSMKPFRSPGNPANWPRCLSCGDTLAHLYLGGQ